VPVSRGLRAYIDWASGLAMMPDDEVRVRLADHAFTDYFKNDKAWQRDRAEVVGVGGSAPKSGPSTRNATLATPAVPGSPGPLLQTIREEVGRLNQCPSAGDGLLLTCTVYLYRGGGWFSNPKAHYELVARDRGGKALWVVDEEVVAQPEMAHSLAAAPRGRGKYLAAPLRLPARAGGGRHHPVVCGDFGAGLPAVTYVSGPGWLRLADRGRQPGWPAGAP
jgi:hypothetical protein